MQWPRGRAHPALPRKPGKPAWGVAVPSEARQEATDWIPRSHTPAGLGAGFSAPLPSGPSWGLQLGGAAEQLGAAVGLRREGRGPPQLFPAWVAPGKQREGGGPRAGGEVLCGRHWRPEVRGRGIRTISDSPGARGSGGAEPSKGKTSSPGPPPLVHPPSPCCWQPVARGRGGHSSGWQGWPPAGRPCPREGTSFYFPVM